MKRKHLITKISTMLITYSISGITVFAGALTFEAQKVVLFHKATAKSGTNTSFSNNWLDFALGEKALEYLQLKIVKEI